MTSTHGDTHGIVLSHQLFACNIFPDFNAGPELDSFLAQQRKTAVDHVFVQFEVWYAVTQQNTPKNHGNWPEKFRFTTTSATC
jgi:hypothetical protein